MRKSSLQSGFLLISLLIVMAIIGIMAAFMLKPKNQKESLQTTKQNAQKDLQESNKKLKNYQNQLNQENQ